MMSKKANFSTQTIKLYCISEVQYYVTDLCHGKRKEWGGILCYIISQGGSCKCAENAKSVIYLCQGGGSKCGWNAKLRVLSTFGFAKGEVQSVGGMIS